MQSAALVDHIHVDPLSAEESDRCGRNEIIHHRVELIALQPSLRLMPDLPDNIRLGVDSPHTAAEFLPE